MTVFLLFSCTVHAKEQENYPYKTFQPFKMSFLPDIHLSFREKDSWILYKESLVIFQDVMNNLKKVRDLNFVVFGGNLIANDNGNFSELPMFLDMVSDLNIRHYVIPGNREADTIYGFSKEDFAREFDVFDYENRKQTFWTAQPVENVLLIGLDTSVADETEGYINIHQLFWLDSVLKNNSDKFTVILMHHSPHLSLQKPDLFLDVLNMYPQVKLVLSGHAHTTLVKRSGEKLFITCPSIVSYPNEYKIFEIHPDRVKIKNKKISFKQIIRKAKRNLSKNPYGNDFNPKGNRSSRKGKYYFER